MKRYVLVIVLILAWSVRAVNAQDNAIKGTIDDKNSFVEVPFTVTEDGSTITLDIVPTSGDLDTTLYLVDQNNLVIAENDDRSEDDSSSQIVFPYASAGRYTAIGTRYGVGDGDTTGD